MGRGCFVLSMYQRGVVDSPKFGFPSMDTRYKETPPFLVTVCLRTFKEIRSPTHSEVTIDSSPPRQPPLTSRRVCLCSHTLRYTRDTVSVAPQQNLALFSSGPPYCIGLLLDVTVYGVSPSRCNSIPFW